MFQVCLSLEITWMLEPKESAIVIGLECSGSAIERIKSHSCILVLEQPPFLPISAHKHAHSLFFRNNSIKPMGDQEACPPRPFGQLPRSCAPNLSLSPRAVKGCTFAVIASAFYRTLSCRLLILSPLVPHHSMTNLIFWSDRQVISVM